MGDKGCIFTKCTIHQIKHAFNPLLLVVINGTNNNIPEKYKQRLLFLKELV